MYIASWIGEIGAPLILVEQEAGPIVVNGGFFVGYGLITIIFVFAGTFCRILSKQTELSTLTNAYIHLKIWMKTFIICEHYEC